MTINLMSVKLEQDSQCVSRVGDWCVGQRDTAAAQMIELVTMVA